MLILQKIKPAINLKKQQGKNYSTSFLHSSYYASLTFAYLWYMYSLAAGKNGLLSKLANLYVRYMQVFGRR